MTKPLDAVGNAINSVVGMAGTAATHAIAPLSSALSRGVIDPTMKAIDRGTTMSGAANGAPNINIDTTTSQPGKLPASKPSGRGVQSSFLSGVAGGAAATGLRGGGSSSGKSLLGS